MKKIFISLFLLLGFFNTILNVSAYLDTSKSVVIVGGISDENGKFYNGYEVSVKDENNTTYCSDISQDRFYVKANITNKGTIYMKCSLSNNENYIITIKKAGKENNIYSKLLFKEDGKYKDIYSLGSHNYNDILFGLYSKNLEENIKTPEGEKKLIENIVKENQSPDAMSNEEFVKNNKKFYRWYGDFSCKDKNRTITCISYSLFENNKMYEDTCGKTIDTIITKNKSAFLMIEGSKEKYELSPSNIGKQFIVQCDDSNSFNDISIRNNKGLSGEKDTGKIINDNQIETGIVEHKIDNGEVGNRNNVDIKTNKDKINTIKSKEDNKNVIIISILIFLSIISFIIFKFISFKKIQKNENKNDN